MGTHAATGEHPDRSGRRTPDVSVILAVHNAMPHLTRCLNSLMRQSIGGDRMEIVAVDDGSTDGSGRELDRFARRYPDTVQVIHQAHTGGLAAPSNQGLEWATGRYVFFVAPADRLGVEALERLVAAADRWRSDVVLGRVVGPNRPAEHQALFANTEPDLELFDSPLPWALANTKLFRREMVERLRLRYPDDLPFGGDQPFTLEACYHAERISVLADYDYYHVGRRTRGHAIAPSRHDERLRCAERLVVFAAGLIEPGKQRDAVLLRYFTWEVAKLLGDDFLRLDEAAQERVRTRVAGLVGGYLTDYLRDQLPVAARLRLLTARFGTRDDLVALIRRDVEEGGPATVVEGERWYARYPGFRDRRLDFPDEWFDITATASDWIARLDVVSVNWTEPDDAGTRSLMITAHSPRSDLATLCSGPVRLIAGATCGGPIPGTPVPIEQDPTGAGTGAGPGTLVRTRFGTDELLAQVAPGGENRLVRAEVNALRRPGGAPVRASRRPVVQRVICRRGARLYVITPTINHRGELVIAIAPFTPRRVIARLRRELVRGEK